MERCPLCRATLNGAEVCRRCKAELRSVLAVAREADGLAGAAMHRLVMGDRVRGRRLVRQALAVRATPALEALWRLASASVRGVDVED